MMGFGARASTSAVTLASVASPLASSSRVQLACRGPVQCLLPPATSSRTFASATKPAMATSAASTETSVQQPRVKFVPRPRDSINTPSAFVSALAKPRRGDLSTILSALGGEEATWEGMFSTDRKKLKAAGVSTKERRYFLWALEKYRQGCKLDDFAIDVKPKKKVRGWGPRVQNGIRVRGRRRPGEK